MYCKTKSIFTLCTADVTYLEGCDIRSPIYDYSDFEEEFLPHGSENAEQQTKPKTGKKKKHKHKQKHKRKCKEKRDQEQVELEAQNPQKVQNAKQKSITKKLPFMPAATNIEATGKR